MKKSVGLVIITTDTPITPDTIPQPLAWLRRRGMWNFEKNRVESFRGLHQITVHGKLEESESTISDDSGFLIALKREIVEELGSEFLLQLDLTKLQLVSQVHTDSKHIKSFMLITPFASLTTIKQEPGGGGLEPISTEQSKNISTLTGDFRILQTQIFGGDQISMFPDESLVVQKALLLSDQKV